MIPGIDLAKLLSDLGPLIFAVAPLMIFAETGLMVGFFLPGDSLLFTAGALIGIGIIHQNIWLLLPLLFVAAVLGNSLGYEIGKRLGPKLFAKKDSRFFKQKYLTDAKAFYTERGASAIVLAQFIPIIRTFNPVVAGISGMSYRKFISFNMIGALIWSVGVALLGYITFNLFGHFIDPADIDKYLLPIILLILVVSLLPVIIRIVRSKLQKNPAAHHHTDVKSKR